MRCKFILLCALSVAAGNSATADEQDRRIELPRAETVGEMTVEEALKKRRSVREFRSGGLALGDVGQLLWAAQGVTNRVGFRTAPSAGALYPLELYLVAGNVEGLSPGVFRYSPRHHELIAIASGDLLRDLSMAALGQEWVRRAPAVLVIAGVYERSAVKYGRRAERYTHIEVGHVAQNVYLQATALRLGTVLVGAFRSTEVRELLKLPSDHEPLGIMPVGRIR